MTLNDCVDFAGVVRLDSKLTLWSGILNNLGSPRQKNVVILMVGVVLC